jgi:DNA-binding NarL/FixJ family response regulator
MRNATAVFLLSGNRLLREALQRVLGKRRDIEVVGTACCIKGASEALARSRSEIVLTDLWGSVPSEVQPLRELLAAHPAVRAILLGMREDDEVFLDSVRAGVRGFLLDDASAMDVVAAIRAVSDGQAVCPPRLTATLFDYVAQMAAGMPSIRIRMRLGLTRREQQLVPMIAEGLTNKQIAAQLNLSEQTVKNHIHRMLQKAGAADRLSIVEMCRMQGVAV